MVVDNPDEFLVPPRCTYKSQLPRLFSEQLRANILMGILESRVNLNDAVRTAVLDGDVDGLAAGLETMVGPRGVTLSGGQVQRTAAARMFVRVPELLVLDDVSSALDVETEQQLWQRVSELNGVTSLVVSNRSVACRHADHIVVLKDGKVEAEGTLPNLLRASEEMRQLWAADLSEGNERDVV